MKKGFTLIELLAVILILAILFAIATINILARIEKSKKDARAEQMSFIVDAARKYAAMNEEKLIWINNQTIVYLRDIQDESLLPEPLKDPTGGAFDNRKPEGVKVILTRGANNYYTSDLLLPEYLKYYFDKGNIGIDPSSWEYKYKYNGNYFVGPNPNNWLEFGQVSSSDSTPILWRVIKSDSKGIRIIYEGPKNNNNVPTDDGKIIINGEVTVPWDELKLNKWERPASIKLVLDNWESQLYVINKVNYLEPINWCIGAIPVNNPTTINAFLNSECTDGSYSGGEFKGITSEERAIGLINPSDYILTSNSLNCNSSNDNSGLGTGIDCGKLSDGTSTNFLYKDNYHYWTMNARADSDFGVWSIYIGGYVSPHPSPSLAFAVRPVLNLKDTVLYGGGNGTLTNPYKVR
ncbi:MAG: type II secretion system protein [Bacilli bacterium]|nr:type II secretion system protein [Bacilli bacterium]